jgi:hypothetical protein
MLQGARVLKQGRFVRWRARVTFLCWHKEK